MPLVLYKGSLVVAFSMLYLPFSRAHARAHAREIQCRGVAALATPDLGRLRGEPRLPRSLGRERSALWPRRSRR